MVAERTARDRALAAPGRTDDEADLPVLASAGNVGFEVLRRLISKWHVEHPGDLLNAERIVDGTKDGGFDGWHESV
jgi:hypothetical protein